MGSAVKNGSGVVFERGKSGLRLGGELAVPFSGKYFGDLAPFGALIIATPKINDIAPPP